MSVAEMAHTRVAVSVEALTHIVTVVSLWPIGRRSSSSGVSSRLVRCAYIFIPDDVA